LAARPPVTFATDVLDVAALNVICAAGERACRAGAPDLAVPPFPEGFADPIKANVNNGGRSWTE